MSSNQPRGKGLQSLPCAPDNHTIHSSSQLFLRFGTRGLWAGSLHLGESAVKKGILTTDDNRVEGNGRLSPIPLLPLVKPDVRISRIRLSCKRSSLPTLIPSVPYTFSPAVASGKREYMEPIVSLLQQEPFAPQELPCFPSTTIPSDFRRWGPWTTPTLPPSAGSPRLLDFSFPTRCLQPRRGARRLRSSVASPTMAGFVQSGRLAAPTLCNEAEP